MNLIDPTELAGMLMATLTKIIQNII